jgi:hypothetical protein
MKSAVLFAVVVALSGVSAFTSQAWAQDNTITENVNNTGIPRQAPGLSLGQIYGLNPCATGATAGVTTPLFGIAGAVSNIDRECETRNNAAVVITALHDETMAREVLCTIKDVREAAARIGKPCLGDGRTIGEASHTVAELMHTPEVAAASPAPVEPTTTRAVAAMQQAAVQRPREVVLAPDAPAFCHAKDLALYLYPECNGGLKTPGSPVSAVAATTHASTRRHRIVHPTTAAAHRQSPTAARHPESATTARTQTTSTQG